ncbi:MAG TPA: HprK-related kinase A [Alphaproteobacteria bacterium]|nr:HprK-related kinase A [Alphaproteobacteria bacterium]
MRFGPFTAHIVSTVSTVSGPFWTLYSEFNLSDEGVADFHLRLISGGAILTKRAELFAEGRSLFGSFPREESFAMLEWGMNACVCAWAHNFLIIHAAIVARDNIAVVIPGGSGSGKSTLAAALVAGGWRLLSDELTLIRPDSGEAVPVVRPISLKNESLQIAARLFSHPVFGPTLNVRRKGRMAHLKPDSHSVGRGHEPAFPGIFVFPAFGQDFFTELQPLQKARTFLLVAENALNYGVLGRVGFETLTRLIDNADGYRLQYGNLEAAVDEVEKLLLERSGCQVGAKGAA